MSAVNQKSHWARQGGLGREEQIALREVASARLSTDPANPNTEPMDWAFADVVRFLESERIDIAGVLDVFGFSPAICAGCHDADIALHNEESER